MRALPPLALVAATALVVAACQRPATEAAAPTTPVATATDQAPAPAASADPRAAIQAQRAAQAAIWGMPVVNYDLMRQQMLTRTQGKENQIIYWGRPLDWHNQTLTPNPDTLYFMAFFDTHETGPLVLEIPAASEAGSLNANIVNAWQVPLQDAGRLGADQGKGMKLLILPPPGYQGKPPAGHTVVQPGTYGGYALIRSNLKSHSDADVARAIDYARQVKLYPLSQAAHPPPTVFTDVGQADFDSTLRYDETFFDNLNHVVQEEPWLERDRAMIDVLKSIGIEKGKPYDPGPELKQRQREGVQLAQAYLAQLYEEGFPAFYEGTHWMYPTHPELVEAASGNFSEPDQYPVDYRGLGYTYAYIAIKHLGAGQFYLIATRDKDGQPLDGARTYRLHVPANPPIGEYWSLTAYDRQSHALIRNMSRASRASNAADLVRNEDGSVDLYIGPRAPAGQDANWIPTDPQRGFELMFRAYGPEKSFFDKQWTLPDLEPGQ